MQAKSSRAIAREDLAASYLKQPTLKSGVSDLHHDQYELPSSFFLRVIEYYLLREPSQLESVETWKMFPSGDDPLPPYPTWVF